MGRVLVFLALVTLGCSDDTTRRHRGVEVSISDSWLAKFWRGRGYQGSCLPSPWAPRITMYARTRAEVDLIGALLDEDQDAVARHELVHVCWWQQAIAHEMAHADQVHKMTPPVFLGVYLVEVVWAGVSFQDARNVPLEETARNAGKRAWNDCAHLRGAGPIGDARSPLDH